MASVGDHSPDCRPLSSNPVRWIVGDLIFSRSGYSGVVLDAWHDKTEKGTDLYLVLWTITSKSDDRWWFNEQIRNTKSLRKL